MGEQGAHGAPFGSSGARCSDSMPLLLIAGRAVPRAADTPNTCQRSENSRARRHRAYIIVVVCVCRMRVSYACRIFVVACRIRRIRTSRCASRGDAATAHGRGSSHCDGPCSCWPEAGRARRAVETARHAGRGRVHVHVRRGRGLCPGVPAWRRTARGAHGARGRGALALLRRARVLRVHGLQALRLRHRLRVVRTKGGERDRLHRRPARSAGAAARAAAARGLQDRPAGRHLLSQHVLDHHEAPARAWGAEQRRRDRRRAPAGRRRRCRVARRRARRGGGRRRATARGPPARRWAPRPEH